MKKYFLYLMTMVLVQAMALTGLEAQTADEVFSNGNINSQLEYIEARTRIYENYRAIREDMFQDLSSNVMDTISSLKNTLNTVSNSNAALAGRADSLSVVLQETNAQLEEMTRTKNSLKFLGINISKTIYNIIMWGFVLILGIIVTAGFKNFKNNRTVAVSLKSELENLRTEYEEYRKKARQEKERMSTDHFNEIKRLRGK